MVADPRTPWEPPVAGTETEHLLAALDRLRATFRWKAGGLDAAGLAQRLPPSELTLGGLLHHLAAVEDIKTAWDLFGRDPGEPWRSVDWETQPDYPFTAAADLTPEQLYARWDSAVARSRERVDEALAQGGLDFVTRMGDQRGQASLRRLLFDLVEEYGRHTGHADLLREAVDGVVGEDPPPLDL